MTTTRASSRKPSLLERADRAAESLIRSRVLENRYVPHAPTRKQATFLVLPVKEALYGGAAGGGKSDALLMAALMYVDVPGYAAMLFRKTFPDLALPGALMDRAHEWLGPTDARWDEREKTWTFASGATMTFGYLDAQNDRFRYQSAEFQFIGFDELTQFREVDFRYLFSRLRRLEGVTIPLRMRAASNPGGIGHEWVHRRFIVERDRIFIPAKLEDNPHLDRETYEESLLELDPVTRAQLRHGDWSVRPPGRKFRRGWFDIIDELPVDDKGQEIRLTRVRYWDLAATEPKAGRDPDWTAGALVGRDDQGIWYILDIRRTRRTPHQVETLITNTAGEDGRIPIWIEQEPGASGKSLVSHYQRNVLRGHAVRGHRATGPKEARADPVSARAENGQVKLLSGTWVSAFLDEAEAFPDGEHDDQVDAVSGAFAMLGKGTASSEETDIFA